MEIRIITREDATSVPVDDISRIDALGRDSARAQGLKEAITSFSKFVTSDPPQTLFLLYQDGEPRGLLKIGRKTLWFHDGSELRQHTPLCVLDFYVSTQRQRCGIELFKAMLDHQGASADTVAYDRPSEKLKMFLNKHFKLNPQLHANKFAFLINRVSNYLMSFFFLAIYLCSIWICYDLPVGPR